MIRKKKLTVQEMRENTEKALRYQCAMAGKPFPEDMAAPERIVKPQRAPPTKSDIPLEHEEQCAFIKWFHKNHPKVVVFAVPNAAMRDYKLAAYLKAEGMTAGVPDLHIPEWKTVIEFKRKKGSVISEEQYWFQAYYERIGWIHFLAYGWEDAVHKLQESQNGR